MPDATAHQRRSRSLLDWISTERADAMVLWRSENVGAWKNIQARWSRSGRALRFQFRARDRSVAAWISSVQPSPWGAKILLKNHGQPLPDEMHVVWREGPLERSPQSRNQWQAARQWIQQKLPGCRIVAASQRADRAHTLSGSYLRLYLRHGGRDYLLLASTPQTPAEVDSPILTQGLLWLHYLRNKKRLIRIPTIYLVVPVGRAGIIYHRSSFLNRDRVNVEIWEYEEGSEGEWKTKRAFPPPPPEENRDFRWPVLGPFRWSALLARVLDLAPQYIRRYPRFHDYDSLRLWGLEFARVLGAERDRICFGLGFEQTELQENSFEDLRSLVNEILFFRRPDTPDTHHLYYRLQSERWLECLILEDVQRLFPELAPQSVYPQIPVYLGKDPGRVDILGVDRDGTLVVIELKISEDPDLPLQSLDYWARVIQHNNCGDFQRRGYFAESPLNRRRPKIYLVSPVFSFHDSTERILRYLEADLEIWKIAVNEDWRSGVKILQRSRLKCGDLP